MTSFDPSRRQVLRVTGAALAGGAVAGCSAAPGESSDAGGDGGDGGSDGESSGSDGTATSSGDGGSSGEWTQASTVEMTDQLAYAPKRIEVSAGTTVTFENVGNVGHTVTAYEEEIPDGATYFASGDFESQQAASDAYSSEQAGNVPAGESYEHTFETTGTYEYYCIPHELNGMVGYVKVV
ncbi:plastocyanin/azurin family copper-binding protein [Halosimplex pelagicum]|uniref:Copper-binding protein n=1 Tax=Halosimplex pelagicum TaxID=869886 RepID=A0A7D5PBT5_9EURY|nr:plastocyanin/azurin family copper-binding protein [Halosimplex pelagicum]QLH84044.1 copper-binding protein [Halosimplex pelagicum]